jgi:ketosteroid isomerase-like protein
MSEENVAVVRETLAAFNREGVEAALAYIDTEIEWIGPPEWLEKRMYRGHEGIRELAGVWTESFDEYRLDPVEFIDAGDRVVALIYQRGRIKGSTNPIELKTGYLWTVRDGKGVHVQVYFSWEEPLAELGLTADRRRSEG